MMRWFDAALIALMVFAAGVTFWVKYDARRAAQEVAALERRIELERAAIELQNADWSLLSQPERLQVLVEAHEGDLALRTPTPDQFIRLDRLGGELDALAPASVEDAIAELAAEGPAGTDATVTGAVE